MNIRETFQAGVDWLRRALFGEQSAPQAGYDAAKYSTRRSRISTAVQSARFDAANSTLEIIRGKAREFERNSAVVNRLADLWEQYTVGQGLIVQPASSDPVWNEKAAEWWRYWAELPDISSRQPLGSLLGMVARGWFIDGEQFILLTTGQSGFPRVQLVESHLVKTPKGQEQTESIIDGIRVDPVTLRPLSFFVHTETRRGGTTIETAKEVSADSVLQVFEPSRPGQIRGIPLLHAVINDLHDLDDLQQLEMRAAKDAAQTSKVIKTGMEEINPAALRAARVTGTTTISTGATASVTKTEYYRDAVGEESVILRPGDEYLQFQTTRPSVASRDYWRFLTEKVCIGVGIPYVIAFPDSMQGTVYRGALDAAAAFFRLRSAVMQSAVARIYAYAMGWARYTEKTLQNAPADWRKIRISPPRAPNVDIGYSADALMKGLQTATTNWGQHFASLGLDWREEIDSYAEQSKYITSKGIVISFGNTPQPPQPAQAQSEDNQPTEDTSNA